MTGWLLHDSGTIEQTFTATGRVDSGSLTQVALELSEDYNNAMIAVERANKGFSILDKLMDAQDRYNFDIYSHSEFDQEEGVHKLIPGWRPTKASKSAAIGRFEEMYKTGECIIHDSEILDQALSYQYNPISGKAEAPEGSYDDLLTTAQIACYISEDVPVFEQFTVKDVIG